MRTNKMKLKQGRCACKGFSESVHQNMLRMMKVLFIFASVNRIH